MDSPDRVQTQACSREAFDLVADVRAASDDINLAELEPLTTLRVRTANTLYRIIVVRGTNVLIQGGKSFPETTTGELFSFGVKSVRFGWIGVGLRMEIYCGHRCVVTSPVRHFAIEPPAAGG